MIIESNRLVLRPWQDEDTPLLYQYASDPDVGPRAGWAPHQSVEESLHIIQTVFRNPTTWAIVLKDSDLLVGAIGYGPSCDCNLPAREGEPTVGYWVAKPFWNQGLCTEALQLLIAHLRQQNESNANTGEVPTASRAVINKNYASRILTFFRDASYGLYILQFFVYMSIGYLLRAYTALPPWAMYILLFLAMFTLTPALYLLIRRIPILRYCVLGLSSKNTAA